MKNLINLFTNNWGSERSHSWIGRENHRNKRFYLSDKKNILSRR